MAENQSNAISNKINAGTSSVFSPLKRPNESSEYSEEPESTTYHKLPPKWYPSAGVHRHLLKVPRKPYVSSKKPEASSQTDPLEMNKILERIAADHCYAYNQEQCSSQAESSPSNSIQSDGNSLKSQINTPNVDFVVKEEPIDPAEPSTSAGASNCTNHLKTKEEPMEPQPDFSLKSPEDSKTKDSNDIYEQNACLTTLLEESRERVAELESEREGLLNKIAKLKEKVITCSNMAVNAILERDNAESEAKMMKRMQRFAPSLPFTSLRKRSERQRRLAKIIPMIKRAAGNCETEDEFQKCYKEIIELLTSALVNDPERTVLTAEEDYNIFIKNGLSWGQRALIKRALIKLDLDILASTNSVFFYSKSTNSQDTPKQEERPSSSNL